MNIRLVIYWFAKLCFLCSFAMLIPIFIALSTDKTLFWGLISSFSFTFIVGVIFYKKGEAKKRFTLNFREILLVIIGNYLLFCFFVSLPYIFTGKLSFFQAIFESISCLDRKSVV